MPKLAVNGVARFAVLRWTVNEDDDECLRLRLAGSLQAEAAMPALESGDLLYTPAVPTRTAISKLAPSHSERCCHDHSLQADSSTLPPCTVVRDGGYRPHPPGMPSRNLPGDLFLFLPHGVTVDEISPPA